MYDEPENQRWTCADYVDAAKGVAFTFGVLFFLLLSMLGFLTAGDYLFSAESACIGGKLHEKQHSVWVQTDKVCTADVEQETAK